MGTNQDPAGSVPADAGLTSVRLARRALEEHFDRSRRPTTDGSLPSGPADPFLDAPRGVFVTLRTYPDHDLRGCVGYPRAVYPLRSALARAAVAAAVDDPRFRPVMLPELVHLVVEVSLLTDPVPLGGEDRERWPESVEVGRHGLIVEDRRYGGLLLPQVAPEQGWNSRQFLEGTCEKAGLSREAWRRPEVRVLTFEAIVFEEDRPGGEVRRH